MSAAFSFEKIDSISGESSPGEIAPLIKRCKARSLESGKGGSPAGVGNTDVAYIEQTVNGISVQG